MDEYAAFTIPFGSESFWICNCAGELVVAALPLFEAAWPRELLWANNGPPEQAAVPTKRKRQTNSDVNRFERGNVDPVGSSRI